MGKSDRLKARCPFFRARVDWKGMHLIECAALGKGFGTVWERNRFYVMNCCGDPAACPLREYRRTHDERQENERS